MVKYMKYNKIYMNFLTFSIVKYKFNILNITRILKNIKK